MCIVHISDLRNVDSIRVTRFPRLYYNSFKTSMLNIEKMFMKSLFAIRDLFCKL